MTTPLKEAFLRKPIAHTRYDEIIDRAHRARCGVYDQELREADPSSPVVTHRMTAVGLSVSEPEKKQRRAWMMGHNLFREKLKQRSRRARYLRIKGLRRQMRNLPPTWLGEYAGASAREILAFCRQYQILGCLKVATIAAVDCFPSRKALRIFIDNDPEEEGQWIIVQVATNQDVDEFLKAYNRCVSFWVDRIPVQALALIRLSYSLT